MLDRLFNDRMEFFGDQYSSQRRGDWGKFGISIGKRDFAPFAPYLLPPKVSSEGRETSGLSPYKLPFECREKLFSGRVPLLQSLQGERAMGFLRFHTSGND